MADRKVVVFKKLRFMCTLAPPDADPDPIAIDLLILDDAPEIAAANKLDRAYLARQAKKLGVTRQLDKALGRAR